MTSTAWICAQADEDIVESDLNLYYEIVHHDPPQKVNPSRL
jgi:hypothetical protein